MRLPPRITSREAAITRDSINFQLHAYRPLSDRRTREYVNRLGRFIKALVGR